MEGQNRQKSEGVVILYKIDFLKKIKVKNYITLNATVINFLLDLSNELKKQKKIYSYPELVYLMFWCSDKNLKNLLKDYKTDKLRLGRGLVFHICAANVSTNFVFSFIFGILGGNSNIIKIPTKETKEKKIILSILKKILNLKKYSELKKIIILFNIIIMINLLRKYQRFVMLGLYGGVITPYLLLENLKFLQDRLSLHLLTDIQFQ